MERIEKQPVDLNGKAILVTGAAGFIGSNLCKRLLRETTESVIVGIDCMTDYNPIELKEWRLKYIQETFEQDGIDRKNQWIFVKADIADEPTGNLDPETSWDIMRIFSEINESGTTIVMATHDKEIVDNMEKRVIAIEKGSIVRDDLKGVYGYES